VQYFWLQEALGRMVVAFGKFKPCEVAPRWCSAKPQRNGKSREYTQTVGSQHNDQEHVF
jgi:hypothetical protein